MCQLIEAQEGDLGALPIQNRGVVLQMAEAHLGSGSERPSQIVEPWTREAAVYPQARIPERSFFLYVRQGPAKDDRSEARLTDMAKRFQQERKALASAGRPAIDRNISGRTQEGFLGSRLRPNRDRWTGFGRR